ncbi:MAG: GAF domain-containing protein [Tepidisphaeraceae bacterium]
MKRVTRTTPRWLFLLIALCLVAVFVADFYTPRNVAVWVLYVVPVGIALWAWEAAVPPVVAGLASALMVLTFFTDDTTGANTLTVAISNRAFGVSSLWATAFVGYAFILNRISINREQWLQDGVAKLGERIAGDRPIDVLAERVVTFLAERTDAQSGAVFVESGGYFRRAAAYALPADSNLPDKFNIGEGLMGQAVKNGRETVIDDVSDSAFRIVSSLGHGTPARVVITPMQADGAVQLVVELSFLRHSRLPVSEFLERIDESIAIAVRSAKYRSRLQELLEETQRQTEELQAQGEELRVSNEELAEQSRALKESQVRLEQQQAELEQTNTQLEEQTQLLAAQKDSLTESKTSLQEQARRSNRRVATSQTSWRT